MCSLLCSTQHSIFFISIGGSPFSSNYIVLIKFCTLSTKSARIIYQWVIQNICQNVLSCSWVLLSLISLTTYPYSYLVTYGKALYVILINDKSLFSHNQSLYINICVLFCKCPRQYKVAFPIIIHWCIVYNACGYLYQSIRVLCFRMQLFFFWMIEHDINDCPYFCSGYRNELKSFAENILYFFFIMHHMEFGF